MFTMKQQPRFSETDALGHINNTVIPVWFESARDPVFRIFNASLDLNSWNLIIAKIEVNYSAQIQYQAQVEIRTSIKKVGNSSFTVFQQVFQADQCVAFGECIMVKFDYVTNKSAAITDEEKAELNKHLIEL
ncbi:acyl-CoA thioesterase [Psychrosphaera sp. F3M07]|jgi:acyl-CoA thioester hydrolase|uniref:acyl-CoA thioesterase n=1 Tax=Psychrosphaera sp. F3M07 TaxID=2841560 RepID=UPI001C0806F2|nr:thioesterase family protein [Psychrosphaera sp. F3M07]MBU2917549.1 acyl-CoA thioesterase [Psychrosphaera sp. F3M07]